MKKAKPPIDAEQAAKKALRESEELFRTFFDKASDGIVIVDAITKKFIHGNATIGSLLGYTQEEIERLSVTDIHPPKDLPRVFEELEEMVKGEKTLTENLPVLRKDGSIFYADVSAAPAVIGGVRCVLGIFRDITERKKAEEERKTHIRFLESLERVDRAIKQETNVEQMLRHILETVFSIFDCDRVWLFYPCDPDAPTFRVPMEITRPEYPGAKVLNVDLPMSPDMSSNLREALASDEPVIYTVGTERPVNKVTAEIFGVQSQMFVALYPKLGKPWVFGMHQCSYPRVWTTEEKKLFTEIARRISDGLSSVLFLRELRENEERFRATFEQAAVGIGHAAPDGRLLRVNRKMCDVLGYSREELLQKTFQDITYPQDRDANRESVRRLLAGEIPPYSMEKRYLRKDDTPIWVDLTVSIARDPSGDIAYLIGVFEDITKRKKTELALEKSENFLRTLVQTIPDLVWLKDAAGVYLFCNKTFERLFGAKEAEIIGKTDYDFVEKELADFFREYDRKAMAAGKSNTNEEWVTFADNGYHALLETIKTPMYDAEGKIVGVLGIAHDITQRKQTEEEHEKLQAQLLQAQKMESVGRLAGGVAHDFNNMLGVILGHAELALRQMDPAEPLHASLEEIRKAGQRAADLTRQLLAFARKQTVAPKVLDLNDTVGNMLSMLRRLIGEDVDLAWMPGKDVWPVKMDPSQVDQILANLCVNARDACAGIGKVTIATSNIAFDEASCAVHTEFIPGEYVQLTVSDSGCGMEKEVLQNLFEPFFTTKGAGQGTGLGLSTVYGIVKQNRGFINVDSELGVGSTFNIYLQRYVGEWDRVLTEGRPQTVAGGQETILLVEDEQALLNLSKEMLESFGYRVLAVGRPGEAIKLAEEFTGKIELLVTDVVMPGMTGLDLSKRLLLLYPDIKRLFMSGYTADIIAEHGILEEGVHFLQKPFSPNDLSSKVREALGKKE